MQSANLLLLIITLLLFCKVSGAAETISAVATLEQDTATIFVDTPEPADSIASAASVQAIQPEQTTQAQELTKTMRSLEIVESVCRDISNKLASVSYRECAELGMKPSGHSSVSGTPLLVKEYPPLGNRRPQARILVVGGTHGDELSSISVVFKWMHTLEQHHSGLFHWRINPLMNPDGALRKKHQRTNANGVDLNRNFTSPDGDLEAALKYWRQHTRESARRYPGPYPLSEPETNWLYQEIQDFRPDVVISVHAPYSLVDYDAPNRNNAPQQIGHLYKNLMGTYPGSLGNYAGVHLGVPVVTLELPHAGIMPTRRQISNLWTDLVRWLVRNT